MGIFGIALQASPAHALGIEVNLDQNMAGKAGIDSSTLTNDLSSSIEDELRLGNQSEYLTQMCNAAHLSAKGMGVDYASNPKRFVIGGGFGTAVNSSGVSLGRGDETLPSGGFAFQASLMAGLNLGFAAKDDSFARRIRIYGNWLMANGKSEPFAGSFQNLGAHLQFQLVRPRDTGVFEWGGLAVTSGYESSGYVLTLEQGLPIDSDGVTWDATGKYEIDAKTTSIPIEFSTNLRVLVLTLYGGWGMDFNQGSEATSVISMTGPVETEVVGETVNIGTVKVEQGDRGATEGITPRGFGGVQLNLAFVKVYGHFNVGSDHGFGGHLGARIAL